MNRFLITAVGLALLAGCVSNKNLPAKASGTTFVYEPNARAAGGPKVPVKVAVLPFKDGTENFTTHGSVFVPDSLTINLVKAGIPGTSTALTPELWAKSFTADMTASNDFQVVRFVYNPAELLDEEVYIEGTVERAYGTGSWDKPNEIALGFRAVRRADNRPTWEKKVTTGWIWRRPGGCGGGHQCVVDQRYADVNKAMQALFAEAREDLVATLAVLSGSQAGEGGLQLAASPGAVREEEIVGVGMEVNVVNNILTVARTVQGAPASKAGMQAGDRILSVDGKPTAGATVAEAVGGIRGIKGTSVTLGVKREGWDTPRDFTIVRDVIREGGSAPQAQESVEQTIERILKAK